VKQFLEEKGISYQEIDVASDSNAREEMVRKTGRMAVPVIDIDGEAIVGFDRAAIEKSLGIQDADA
jgi:glutaredoxin